MLGLKLFPHLSPHLTPDYIFTLTLQCSRHFCADQSRQKAADRMKLLCNCNRGPKPAFLAQTKITNAHGVFHSGVYNLSS